MKSEQAKTFMKLRLDAGLKLTETAEKLGRNRHTIYNWEEGNTQIPPEALPALKWIVLTKHLDESKVRLLFDLESGGKLRKKG